MTSASDGIPGWPVGFVRFGKDAEMVINVNSIEREHAFLGRCRRPRFSKFIRVFPCCDAESISQPIIVCEAVATSRENARFSCVMLFPWQAFRSIRSRI